MNTFFEMPHSLESETIVLGMMLLLSENNDYACQMLCTDDFYSEAHKKIFYALQKMYENSETPELNILYEKVRDCKELIELGGREYLLNCRNYVSQSYDFEAYTEIVKEKAMEREFMSFFNRQVLDVTKKTRQIDDILVECQDKLYQLQKRKNKNDILSQRDIISGKASKDGLSLLEIMQNRQEARLASGDRGFLGLSCGINELDRQINGLGNGNLIVMAARPGVGKTAFLCHMCVDIAVKNKLPVGIFSLEMSPEQIIERMIANHCNIEQEKLLKGYLDEDFIELSTGMVEIQEAPIYYFDSMNINITSLVIGAKRMKDLYDIKVLFIDYLQLLSGSAKFKNSDSRVNEVSEISRKLKLLSRELNIPIICLSQLNRNVEGRAIKEPMLSDLRDSGSIEQDADIVILLNRPEMYDNSKRPGIITVDVCKNRHGAPAKLDLCMEKQFGRIVSFAEELKEAKRRDSLYGQQF